MPCLGTGPAAGSQPCRLGAIRAGGIDLNKPRIRAALSAALTLAASPHGFTVAGFTAAVQRIRGMAGYTIRQAACDLRKLRGKNLAVKPGHGRRYHIPSEAARTIAALLALRDQVIAPVIAGVRSPRKRRPGPPGIRERTKDYGKRARRKLPRRAGRGQTRSHRRA